MPESATKWWTQLSDSILRIAICAALPFAGLILGAYCAIRVLANPED
jgi:hypothetical protein